MYDRCNVLVTVDPTSIFLEVSPLTRDLRFFTIGKIFLETYQQHPYYTDIDLNNACQLPYCREERPSKLISIFRPKKKRTVSNCLLESIFRDQGTKSNNATVTTKDDQHTVNEK